jgi:chaperonin GroES
MALKPLDDRVVIKPAAPQEKTKSGIILPENAQEKPMQGEVIAVGPGKLTDSGNRGQVSVSVGDQVIYGKYAGTEVEIEGETYKVMRDSELLGVVQSA